VAETLARVPTPAIVMDPAAGADGQTKVNARARIIHGELRSNGNNKNQIGGRVLLWTL